jgi:hypothetical protein
LKRRNSNGQKKHMKKCSPSLAIKEMQIKTTLKFHLNTEVLRIPHQKYHQQQVLASMWDKGTLIHWYECSYQWW